MFEIMYVYTIILGCLYVVKRLANDPDREKIWGASSSQSKFTKMEKEVELLKTQLNHYKNYRPNFEKEPSREESMI